jgi:hypothetical protein
LAQGSKPKGSLLYVGDCRPGNANYSTISEAVAAVPAQGTVYVCPGNYPEQVNITKPLTLEAIASGDNDSTVLTVPPAQLATNIYNLVPCESGVCPIGGNGFKQVPIGAAQLTVENVTGVVNIKGIVADGSGAVLSQPGPFAGFYFDSSTVNADDLETRHTKALILNKTAPYDGYGMLLTDKYSVTPAVTVMNSYFYDFGLAGIFSQVTLIAKENTLIGSPQQHVGFVVAIDASGPTTTLEYNNIENDNAAMLRQSGYFIGVQTGAGNGGTIVHNTISNASFGIWAIGNNTGAQFSILNNSLLGNVTGMSIGGLSAEIGNNTIAGLNGPTTTSIGMLLSCDSVPTVVLDKNTFRGTTTAFSGIPNGMAIAPGSQLYRDVQQIEQNCP